MGHWRNAPPVHAADQFSREVARVSLARALRVVRDGRSVPAGSRAIHRTEPCPCGPRLQSLRLALEQRTGALGRAGRPVREGCSPAGDGPGLGRLSQRRHTGGGTQGHTAPQPNGPAAGRRDILGTIGGDDRPRTNAAKTRSKAKARRELRYVSPSVFISTTTVLAPMLPTIFRMKAGWSRQSGEPRP